MGSGEGPDRDKRHNPSRITIGDFTLRPFKGEKVNPLYNEAGYGETAIFLLVVAIGRVENFIAKAAFFAA
jgi:hypothetical protein